MHRHAATDGDATARSSPSPPPGPAHLLAPAGASPPLVVAVPPSLIAPLWRLVREHLHRRRRNGGTVHPDEQAFADTLRSAYLRQLQVSGHPLPGFPDMASSSDYRARTGPVMIRTDDLAARMGVSPRHARRMARAAGLVQPRRGWWRADDAAALIAARRNR